MLKVFPLIPSLSLSSVPLTWWTSTCSMMRLIWWRGKRVPRSTQARGRKRSALCWTGEDRALVCVCVSIFWKLAVKRPSTLNKCMQTLRIRYQAIGRLMNYVPLLCLKDHIFPLTPSVSYPMRGRSGSNGQPSWSALGTQVLLRHHLLWFTAIMKFKKDLSCCLHWGF